MNYTRWIPYNVVRSPKGFTLVELIIVTSLMGIIIAMALPPYLSWRKNLEYKTTARGVVAALREARSRAITDNQTHQVIFDSTNKQYRLADYTMWTSLAPEVSLNTGATTTPYVVQYNPNGTSSGGTINVQDLDGIQRFQIVVNSTGRVVVTP
jgi:prepilin-type N-terminal cleavage/methylation domain-containing protein